MELIKRGLFYFKTNFIQEVTTSRVMKDPKLNNEYCALLPPPLEHEILQNNPIICQSSALVHPSSEACLVNIYFNEANYLLLLSVHQF